MGMTRTPDEIKKGLEMAAVDCRNAHDCDKTCAYYKECSSFDYETTEIPCTMLFDALALIQKLQDDNAQLNRCIENMTDKLNAMNDEVAKLQAERDAAVADLKDCVTEAAQGDDFDCCFACKYNNEYGGCDRPNYTIEACGVEDFDNKWTWRGVTKEE